MNGALLPGGTKAFVASRAAPRGPGPPHEGRRPVAATPRRRARPGDVIAASADGRVGAHVTLGDGTEEAVGLPRLRPEERGLSAVRAASTVPHDPSSPSRPRPGHGRRLMAPIMLATQMGGIALSPDGRTVAVVEGHQTGEMVLSTCTGRCSRPRRAAADEGGAGLVRRRDRLRPRRDAVRRLVLRRRTPFRRSHGAAAAQVPRFALVLRRRDRLGADGLLVTIGEQHIEAIDVRTGARRWSARSRATAAPRAPGRSSPRRRTASTAAATTAARRTSPFERPGHWTRRDPAGQRRDPAGRRRRTGPGRLRRHRWRPRSSAGASTARRHRRAVRAGKILISGYSPKGDGWSSPLDRPAGTGLGRRSEPSSVWQTAAGRASDRCCGSSRPTPTGFSSATAPSWPGRGSLPPARPAHGCHDGLATIRPGASLLGTAVGGDARARRVRAPARGRRPVNGQGVGKPLPARGYISAATATTDLPAS